MKRGGQGGGNNRETRGAAKGTREAKTEGEDKKKRERKEREVTRGSRCGLSGGRK
jgi:hypothetical protein